MFVLAISHGIVVSANQNGSAKTSRTKIAVCDILRSEQKECFSTSVDKFDWVDKQRKQLFLNVTLLKVKLYSEHYCIHYVI